MLFLSILVISTFACKNNGEKSDAFGNFETDNVIVSAETAGKILEFNAEKGQKVNSGDILAVIDTMQMWLQIKQIDSHEAAVKARRQSIQSQIDVLKEQKKNLQVNEQRIQKMLKDGAATQKQLDDITGQMSVIDKQIESTQTQFTSVNKELEVLYAQRAIAEDQKSRCTVKSPISGTVLETYAEQGELTAPGKAMFKIANLNELNLKVYVSGAQLPGVKIGQQLNVIIDKTDTENQTLPGMVAWISSEAEFTPKIIQTKEERVKLVYAVKVAVKNDGTLKIGMPGEVKW